MYSNNFNILSQTSVTSVFSPKFILFWSKPHFFDWLKKTPSFFSKIATESGLLGCPLIHFKHKKFFIKKKRIKGRGFSGRPIEFHFVLNIAINYYPKSIFWWNEVENQKLQTFIFKMRYYTWCGYIVLLVFV